MSDWKAAALRVATGGEGEGARKKVPFVMHTIGLPRRL